MERMSEYDVVEKTYESLLLFGAGASIPAGILSIDDMTTEFLGNPLKFSKSKSKSLEDENAYRKKFKILSEIAISDFGRSDLEYIMSVIINLKDYRLGSLYESKYYRLTNKLYRVITNGRLSRSRHDKRRLLDELKERVETYIRIKCESIKSTEYFWTLEGLVEKPLEIFTLNYDATLDIFCEQNNLVFTDGFEPNWDVKNFKETNDVNIYKLHGSLYWLKTATGKPIKVPIKGLNLSDVKYLSDETVSEMMIYPALNKNKQPTVYSWLSNRFKEKLTQSQFCIAIGYSFRDVDIKESVVEALLNNSELWLILVNPNASKIKRDLIMLHNELASRIIVMDMDIEKGLTERNLHNYIEILSTARQVEDKANEYQRKSQNRLDSEFWNMALYNYMRINHDDRIKWLVEKLYNEKFVGVFGNFPDTIEGKVCHKSFRYFYDNKSHKNNSKNVWSTIFVASCKSLEYKFFTRREELISNNPINENELPTWASDGGSSDVESYLSNMESELRKMQYLFDKRSKSFKFLTKLLETLSVLTHKEKLKNGGYRHIQPTEILEKYRQNDLGLKKWSVKLIDSLN